MGDFLTVERKGRIAILRMNKPESMNAIGTHEDCEDICSTLQALQDDRSVSCLILTGSGKAFSAGGNLKVARALLDVEIPAIAAVNGHAVGLGADLACLCDIRIAAKSALFACSFIKVGIVPGDGGAWALQQVLGYAKAAELFFTGDRFDADTAKELGLVSQVVEDDQLMDAAIAMAERIVCNPPRALRLTKRLLREAQHSRMSDILELSAAYQAIVHETADNREAINAFVEKRPPVFTGE
ncbi:MAG: enoyl-CoA hydratase [Sphingomonadaceae bacterium]|nr:enoyl-CoA hydratase [Sphingomonadaceae bacterium]